MIEEIRQIQRVVFAIFVRELKTRFGKYRLGYFWALLEPILHIVIFVGIRGVIAGSLRGGAEKFIYHVDYPLFLASGLVPFFMFSHSVSQIMNSINANRGLFYYQSVKPIDAMMARWLLEGVIFIFVWIFIFLALDYAGFKTTIKDPLGLIGIYILFYLFSFGLGLIFCIMVNLFEELAKIMPTIMMLLFFTSGIFFSINIIPVQFQSYLLWNPILHFLELSRTCFFPLYKADMCSIEYVTICTILAIGAGLFLYKFKIKEILASE
ncbi:MAG TPA: ABC transporter permease [Thermodesulfovibrio thiophilus]|nr:ABC transporter permease [Thermodesulfovibrio thiophilus]